MAAPQKARLGGMARLNSGQRRSIAWELNALGRCLSAYVPFRLRIVADLGQFDIFAAAFCLVLLLVGIYTLFSSATIAVPARLLSN
jgi:hypothetical protein